VVSNTTYFAIGDIHGEAAKLASLHAAILDHIAFESQPATIVHLGDYVDRGPDSRGVIERVFNLEAQFAGDPLTSVISLMGNHEETLLEQLRRPSDHWLTSGGSQTLASYGLAPGEADKLAEHVPREHIEWLRRLPSLHHDAQRGLAFVHAGIDPDRFPDCSREVRLWTRTARFKNDDAWPDRPELRGLRVVHGHTPVSFSPEVTARRINVDTAACYGGPLTAVMLKPGAPAEFLAAE